MANETRSIGGIPQIGYGTWNRPDDAAYNGVVAALEIGYRHIDTAQGYQNEDQVGRAMADSSVPRDDIFLTTKVAPENFNPGQVMPSVRQSLEKLRVDQVDLLLLHWPSLNNEIPLPVYVNQLAEVFDAGMAKTIGVSNFTIDLVTRAQELLGDRKIVNNQVEMHVYMQNKPIVDFCKARGISITAYSPLARSQVVNDPVLTEIGEAHGVDAAQIALAFLMAKDIIVIPSAGSRERIAANFHSRLVRLSDEEMTRVAALEEGRRLVNHSWGPTWDV